MGLDRRVTRTRTALIDAFNHLVLERRHRKIRVADIVEKANVGRSTFYEHYRGAEDIHMEALARPFAILADAAAGAGEAERLGHLLGHFWENRQRARDSLAGRSGERAAKMLADLVEHRLDGIALAVPKRLAAVQLAASALAPVRAWLQAEASCAPGALAKAICRGGRQLRAGLAADTAEWPRSRLD